jgi:hypothetical protein
MAVLALSKLVVFPNSHYAVVKMERGFLFGFLCFEKY